MAGIWNKLEHEIENFVYALIVLACDVLIAGVMKIAKYLLPGPEYATHFSIIEAILGGVAVGSIFLGLVCPLILAILTAVDRIIIKLIQIYKRFFP